MKYRNTLLMILIIMAAFSSRPKKDIKQNDYNSVCLMLDSEVDANAPKDTYQCKGIKLITDEKEIITKDTKENITVSKNIKANNSKNKNIEILKTSPKDISQNDSKESKQPREKPTDKITYGDIEYVDNIIPYIKLEDFL